MKSILRHKGETPIAWAHMMATVILLLGMHHNLHCYIERQVLTRLDIFALTAFSIMIAISYLAAIVERTRVRLNGEL